jgi:hypothetical protein
MGRFSFAVVFLLAAPACSNDDRPPPLGDSDGSVIVVPPDAMQNGPCDPPAEGCPCPKEGEELYCGLVYRVSGTKVDCSKGYRTCQTDGGWGACLGASIYMGD